MTLLRSTFAVIVAATLVTGCGDSSTTFDAASTYSPESLARELVFRYKTLNPDRRNVRAARPARKPDAAATKEAKSATKEAQATTLDELIRDASTKAESIPNMTPAEAIRKMADEVGKDASIPEADRKTIADRLRGGGG